jgi:hypothetical protein
MSNNIIRESIYDTLSQNSIPLKDETLLQFVNRCYPADNESRFNYLKKRDSENQIKTWRDFAMILSEISANGDSDMNVYKSSTWAVCQEFLGNLKEKDLKYAQGRGGIWCSDFDVEKGTFSSITVRDMLESLKIHYP